MKVLFPGTFDPFTNGHADILLRAQLMGFSPDVCFLDNPNKVRKFDEQAMIFAVGETFDVNVFASSDHLSTVCERGNYNIVIKGVRNSADFIYEQAMAEYHKQYFNIETIIIPATSHISSTQVRELLKVGKLSKIKEIVPTQIYNIIANDYML